jgi:hypothetical protein
MSTETQALRQTFEALFPHLSSQARVRLADELVKIVNTSTEQGWDLAAITLHTRGARRNQIGTTLQNLRTRAGMTQEDVTHRTRWHGSKVTRIESGRVPVSFVDLEFLLRLYGVTDRTTVEALWVLAQEAHSPRRTTRKAS